MDGENIGIAIGIALGAGLAFTAVHCLVYRCYVTPVAEQKRQQGNRLELNRLSVAGSSANNEFSFTKPSKPDMLIAESQFTGLGLQRGQGAVPNQGYSRTDFADPKQPVDSLIAAWPSSPQAHGNKPPSGTVEPVNIRLLPTDSSPAGLSPKQKRPAGPKAADHGSSIAAAAAEAGDFEDEDMMMIGSDERGNDEWTSEPRNRTKTLSNTSAANGAAAAAAVDHELTMLIDALAPETKRITPEYPVHSPLESLAEEDEEAALSRSSSVKSSRTPSVKSFRNPSVKSSKANSDVAKSPQSKLPEAFQPAAAGAALSVQEVVVTEDMDPIEVSKRRAAARSAAAAQKRKEAEAKRAAEREAKLKRQREASRASDAETEEKREQEANAIAKLARQEEMRKRKEKIMAQMTGNH